MTQSSQQDLPIVVAMSGGVDSSVAALILAEQGYNAVGISMQVWDYRNNGGCSSRATCCAPDDFTDARRVASKIGIPYYVFDFEKTFRAEVIDRFIETYRAGRTPNPCVDCNNRVKFRELRERAERFGSSAVATGHYARIEARDDGYHLLRGVDLQKDQSYFLYGLLPAELEKTVFPVGGYTKAEVREIAKRAGLVTAEKPESQDICFVSGSVQDFLVKIGGARPAGDIVTSDGRKIGEHEGIHRFTVGQRRGLAVGGTAEPLYVLELDPTTNRVFVGPREELEQEGFEIAEANWVAPVVLQMLREQRRGPIRCLAQLRHRHKGALVELFLDEDSSRARARFLQDFPAVCPGQAAVFYDLDSTEVLGGGRILPDHRFATKLAETSGVPATGVE